MPEFCLQKVGQGDPVTERMIKIIAADTDSPLTFTECSQTFIIKSHPADEHAPCTSRLGTELPFKDVKIGCRRPGLMPLHFHEVKLVIQPETAVDLFACVSERRTWGQLKRTEQFSKSAFKPETPGCGARVFISFISLISEGQSIPCQTWTGL